MNKWCWVFVLFLLLSGCSDRADDQPNGGATNGPSPESLAALSEAAKEVKVDLPEFVRGASPEAQETYKLAYANQDVLKYMPCFCGCGNNGHRHNLHCFVQDVKPDGEVVWDRMGYT